MNKLGGLKCFMSNKEMSAEWRVAQVASTLAIENMYMSKQFRGELLLVAQGKKASKELIDELNAKYKQKG